MNWDSSCIVNGVATLQCLPSLYTSLIEGVLGLVGTLAVILIIFAGYKFITAQGDSKKIEEAQKAITFVVIGVVIIFFSFLIVNIIADTTGVKCLKIFGVWQQGSCN